MWGILGISKRLLVACHGVQKQAVARVNTEALKFTAQGVGAVVELDRLLPYTKSDDPRLAPLLKRAKENFEMALEVDSSNTDTMLFLSRLYMNYHIPGVSAASGAALLEAAANAGNSLAQYELGCCLRAEGKILGVGLDGDGMDEKALKYFELAACKKHPEALFVMGSIYFAGMHTEKDVKAAAWCFRNAADQGHTSAATVYGAILAKGLLESGTEMERSDHQSIVVDDSKRDDINDHISTDMAESARHYFGIAVEAGDGLAYEWLSRIPDTQALSQAELAGDPASEPHVTEDVFEHKKV